MNEARTHRDPAPAPWTAITRGEIPPTPTISLRRTRHLILIVWQEGDAWFWEAAAEKLGTIASGRSTTEFGARECADSVAHLVEDPNTPGIPPVPVHT